jgi:hypothetical protein
MSSTIPRPHANSFVIGTAVINTHTHAHVLQGVHYPLSPIPHTNSFILGTAVIDNNRPTFRAPQPVKDWYVTAKTAIRNHNGSSVEYLVFVDDE